MTNLTMPAYGGEVSAIVGMNWVGFPVGTSGITATVCGECGFTELYAKEPQMMWEEWRKQNA